MESFVELDEKALKKIKYIVEELIMTEKTYMQDLQDIVMVRKHQKYCLFFKLFSLSLNFIVYRACQKSLCKGSCLLPGL